MHFSKVHILDFPFAWRLFRFFLDLVFGVYRKRIAIITEWEVTSGNPSVLDVGCGTGQFSKISEGAYLGVDLNESYIRKAITSLSNQNREFIVGDVSKLDLHGRTFDLVLMADLIHHLDDSAAASILNLSRDITHRNVIVMEPLASQDNFLGNLFITHDRGDHIRTEAQLLDIFDKSQLNVIARRQLYLGPIKNAMYLLGK